MFSLESSSKFLFAFQIQNIFWNSGHIVLTCFRNTSESKMPSVEAKYLVTLSISQWYSPWGTLTPCAMPMAAELWAEKVWGSCQFGYSAARALLFFGGIWDLKRILSICKMNLRHFWISIIQQKICGWSQVLMNYLGKVSLIMWDMLLDRCIVILGWWWWGLCCWWVHQIAGLSPLSHWFSICTARCARQCELGQPSKPSSAQGCDPADSSVKKATQMWCGSF